MNWILQGFKIIADGFGYTTKGFDHIAKGFGYMMGISDYEERKKRWKPERHHYDSAIADLEAMRKDAEAVGKDWKAVTRDWGRSFDEEE